MLRRIRRERLIDLAEIAQAIGVTPDAIRRWERGETTPYLRHQRKLQEYFGVPIATLLAPATQEEDQLELPVNS